MSQIELENKRQAEPDLALKHADLHWEKRNCQISSIFWNCCSRLFICEHIADLSEKFARDELYWHTVAQKDIKEPSDKLAEAIPTINLDDSDDSMEAGPSTKGAIKPDISKEDEEIEQLELCVETYEAAV